MTLKTETFAGPSLLLEVESCDPKGLTSVYKALESEVQYALDHPLSSWIGNDYSDFQNPIRMMLWAEGPAAVPYQIELIYNKVSGQFRFWPPAIANTWENIVRYATPDQIELVLEMARRPECRNKPAKEYSKYYTPGLAWAIHEWYKNGTEEIKQHLRELAEQIPEDDPCPQFMELGQYPYGDP